MRAGFQNKNRILIAFIFFLHTVGIAQEKTPENEDYEKLVRDICIYSLNQAVTEIEPLLNREPRLKDINTKIRFIAEKEYFAKANFVNKRVAISYGFCYHNWLVNWAFSIANVVGKDAVNYVEFLDANSQKFEQTDTQLWEMTFEKFAKIDLANFPENKLHSAQIQAISTMKGILAFVIAHEFGHLALNHKPAIEILPMEARKQEYAADLFAMELMSSNSLSGYSELGPILGVSMNTLAAREIGRSFSQTSSHPPTYCRQALLDIKGKWLEKVAANPAHRADSEKKSGKTITDSIKFRNQIFKSCPTP